LGELGQKLKEAREAKGLSLRDVEEATKIRKKYLQALENETFEVIPGKTYAKGFVKNYSNFLNLDTKALLEEFDEIIYSSNSFKEKEYTPATNSPRSSKKEGKLFRLGLVVIAVLLLFIGNSLFNNTSDNPGPENPQGTTVPGQSHQQQPPSSDPSGEPEENEPQEEERQEEVITGVKLEIEIIKDKCWISVRSDGTQVFSGTLSQGDKRVFEGDSQIEITLGNAGAARITHNGDVLPPFGGDGEVVTPPPFLAADQPQT
jgi:cytoskeleton protein RodZ